MKYSLILFLLVGQAWGQVTTITPNSGSENFPPIVIGPDTSIPGDYEFTDHCGAKPMKIKLSSGVILATCIGGKWIAGEPAPSGFGAGDGCNSVNADGLSTAMYCGPLPVSRPEPIVPVAGSGNVSGDYYPKGTAGLVGYAGPIIGAGEVHAKVAPPEPEPIDVPAIQEKRPVVQYHTDCPPLPDGTHGPKGDLCYVEPLFETHWTCRDKSRIKLTAEDGKVYCHKPQVQP